MIFVEERKVVGIADCVWCCFGLSLSCCSGFDFALALFSIHARLLSSSGAISIYFALCELDVSICLCIYFFWCMNDADGCLWCERHDGAISCSEMQ